MVVPRDPIVGRDPELLTIDELLQRLAGGSPSVLELAGEPGIGKTRLFVRAGRPGRGRAGASTLEGSASQLEQELPFGLFVDALDAHLAANGPERCSALDDDARAELAHVFPALRESGDERSDAPQERYRTHRAIRQLLESLSRPQPLVLVLDDLHWADSGSIELLGSLLRRPPAEPCCSRSRCARARRRTGCRRRSRAPAARASSSGSSSARSTRPSRARCSATA